MKHRGWLVDVFNPSTDKTSTMTVASPEPVDLNVARRLAEAGYRRKNNLTPGHQVYATNPRPASVGTAIEAPRCSDPFERGCTNTGRPDGACGKCFHEQKHPEHFNHEVVA